MGTAAAVAGLQMTQQYMSWKNQRQQAKKQAQALSKQAGAAVRQMSYAFQNYEMQRTDAFDAAVNNLMKVRQSSLGLLSSVRAATNEETGGNSRSARALNRAANADVLRTETSIKDNYERQSNEIDLNKEATKLSTMETIENIKAQAPEMPSVGSLLMSMAATGLSSYNSYQNQQMAREAYLGRNGTNYSAFQKYNAYNYDPTGAYRYAIRPVNLDLYV